MKIGLPVQHSRVKGQYLDPSAGSDGWRVGGNLIFIGLVSLEYISMYILLLNYFILDVSRRTRLAAWLRLIRNNYISVLLG